MTSAGNSRSHTVSCSKNNPSAERMWSMPSVPAPADPGRDEDPARPDRDPMTAAEREAWLDRLCAQDDDPSDAPQEYWDPRIVRAAARAGRADRGGPGRDPRGGRR